MNTKPNTQSLTGLWQFRLDRETVGISECWYESELPDQISLPGSLAAQRIGDEISIATPWMAEILDKSWFMAPEYEKYRQPGNLKVAFCLQPDRYYAGAAWYQRDIEIPEAWQGGRVVLMLERPHWETHVWLDGKEIGSNNGLSTPHEYDLGTAVTPGKHRLTVLVDNSLVVDIGVNSHSITDHTQGNWNGVVGRIELSVTKPLWIDDLQVYPCLANQSVTAKGNVRSATKLQEPCEVTVEAELINTDRPAQLPPVSVKVRADGTFECEYSLGKDALPWDEFSPALYRLTVKLENGETRTAVFGLREIATQGTQFTINGRKTFFRGALECCVFPKTGYPPTDVDSWKRIIRIAKAHGLNQLRFHSWCPPEAAFIAADELGFYYQVEAASWANQSTTIGDGKPVDAWVYAEAERILRAYGNHPSFVLMAYGNEPGGEKHVDYFVEWVNHFKAKDTRRLFTGGAGWPEIAENQYHLTPTPRIFNWNNGLDSRINGQPPETCADYRDFIEKYPNTPVIVHETGQWCVYPDFDEIPKYTGHLKPKNFEIFSETLIAHHMGDQAHDFLIASGKLQTLCYKEEIESALRTPGMGGFQLLGLNDFPGQGTALVGVLDAFWDSKGYVTPSEYSRFCNSTVPLARLKKRVFTTDEKLVADIEVAHFGAAPLENTAATWKLVGGDGKTVAEGNLPARTIPVDNAIELGRVNIDLQQISAPAHYKLVVALEGTSFENDWDVWVFPPVIGPEIPAGTTIVVDDLDQRTLNALQSGGNVLLLVPPQAVKGDRLGKVALALSSIFWNTSWLERKPPHTLGLLCDPKHPAFAHFPTQSHTNWQWWYLISRAGAMILDGLPPALRPTVQVVDDWFTNRKLGLMFEGKVGSGKLLVCSIDLKGDNNPVARQMLHSILSYMTGERFEPSLELDADQVRSLYDSALKKVI